MIARKDIPDRREVLRSEATQLRWEAERRRWARRPSPPVLPSVRGDLQDLPGRPDMIDWMLFERHRQETAWIDPQGWSRPAPVKRQWLRAAMAATLVALAKRLVPAGVDTRSTGRPAVEPTGP